MITKTQLEHLYGHQRLSMMEIAQQLCTTHATVLYWLKKYDIQRRSWSESAYVKLNPEGDPFSIPAQLTVRQRELLTAGLLLYWAEGCKKGPAIMLANLDPRMLRLFLTFLRTVCRINERRAFLYVRVHKQFSRTAAKRYWVRYLGLSPSRIFVYPHTDKRSRLDKQRSPYGIATLQFNNTKLKRWLIETIEQYIEYQLPDEGAEKIGWMLKESDGWYDSRLGRISSSAGLTLEPMLN